MARSFRSALRASILSLPIGGERRLTSLVRVPNNSMMGYGNICGVYRHGKNGAARCFDEFNNCYSLSELSEAECQAVLAAL